MRSALAIILLAGACSAGGDFGDDGQPDANQSSDAFPGDGPALTCAIAVSPPSPIASTTIPIIASITVQNPIGPPAYQWDVTFNSAPVTFQQAPDGASITFYGANAGSYHLTVSLTNVPECPYVERYLTVVAPGANMDQFRLRTVPAPGSAPPVETAITVQGGTSMTRNLTIDPGIVAAGAVKNSATMAGVAAYLKFMPMTSPTAYVEAFSSGAGTYSVRLQQQVHQVLVIPGVAGLAPKLVAWNQMTPNQDLLVGAGTLVTGTVRGPGGAGFAGAKVELSAGGVPSTLATTAADGSYSVRTDFPTGATQVTVKVTPPAGSGLPRLEATTAFNLGGAINVSYASSLATCDLANVPVRRGGAAQANAQVSIVGSLAAAAGTIGGVSATNTVRVSATADGTGRLPTMLVPRGSLSAVTELSMSDHAISTVDTSACSVAQIDAPAMTTINGTTKKPDNTAIGGIRVEADPTGALALAGVGPIQVTSNGTGAFALPLAGGGRYTVRFFDPQQRVAPLVATDVAPASVPTNAQLAKALTISGTVQYNNNDPAPGTSIQILCSSCSGLDATRPITETATNSASKYSIAVPDPGTM